MPVLLHTEVMREHLQRLPKPTQPTLDALADCRSPPNDRAVHAARARRVADRAVILGEQRSPSATLRWWPTWDGAVHAMSETTFLAAGRGFGSLVVRSPSVAGSWGRMAGWISGCAAGFTS